MPASLYTEDINLRNCKATLKAIQHHMMKMDLLVLHPISAETVALRKACKVPLAGSQIQEDLLITKSSGVLSFSLIIIVMRNEQNLKRTF